MEKSGAQMAIILIFAGSSLKLFDPSKTLKKISESVILTPHWDYHDILVRMATRH